MAGSDRVHPAENYPLALTEIDGEPLVELITRRCHSLNYSQLIVAVREAHIREYHLDQVVRLLEPASSIVSVEGETEGAACTALLASAHIDNDQPLLILNADELIEVDYKSVVDNFVSRQLDAGTIVFNSVHPRYSFVKLNEDGLVIEAAEKNPISRHATAGFYYFAKGAAFVAAAKNMIRKDARQNGRFYVCPTFNELILNNGRIGVSEIDFKSYRPIKSDRQLQQFDASHLGDR
ncbi:glycosyltransferase family 2 protein [Devosia submarina]|uniref:glycosyltransferase family 2 protein n=1 Tax=Devosia submarina TaxID=1173082 RepID=UPI001FEB75B4|nr:glycosyltransferase family 2 protein [Devosia submarina]